ncbi:hypothetical protein V6N12_062487 [Hibiscus sabdariffa]|uniref:DksA C4-type domain-containing protein n=1 Tax=Hibiscus sabdariffa TaxID=183260 RepID=A0ABR2F952_9ROSI
MQGTDELSMDELASNLSTYKEQLQQVRQLLADDPGNVEYVDMEKELAEESTCCSKKQHQLTANVLKRCAMCRDGQPASHSPDLRCSS